MKKLLLLLPLLFVGCSQESHHIVYCQDVKTKTVTFDGYSTGPVFAFVIKGHSVLWFRDRNGKNVMMFLSKNDCAVN